MTTEKLIKFLKNNINKDLEIYESEDGSEVFGSIDGIDMFDITGGKIIFHCESSIKNRRKSIDYFKSSEKEIMVFMKSYL